MRTSVERYPNGEWRIEVISHDPTNQPSTVCKLPSYMLRQVELLSHLDNGEELMGVGYRVTQDIFYLD